MFIKSFIIIIFSSLTVYAAGTTSDNKKIDNSDQVKILYEKAENFIYQKNYKKSLKLLKSLTKREDLSGFRADIYNLLGFSYRKINKPDLEKSFAAYMMALEIDPEHVGAHEYLGELYLMLDQKEKAILMLDKLSLLVGNEAKEYIDLQDAISNF